MQHIKLWFRRSVPLILICCVFIFALSPSASAADSVVIQWEDLPNTSVVSGSDVTYTLDLMGTGQYFLVLTDPYYEWALGDNPNKVISEGGIYQFDYSTAYFAFDSLFFTDSQSSFYFDWKIEGDPGALGFVSSSLIVRFFDSGGNRIGFQEFVATEDANSGGSAWQANIDPFIPSGASSLNITIKFTFSVEALGLTSVSFPLDYFNYSFTVSADSVQNKQIQEKLDQLSDQQNQTNDKLDDIINGEVSPDLPDGSGSIGDLDDAEGALRDEAQSGLDQAGQIQQGALTVLAQYVSGFAVFSQIFGEFASIPFFSGLLYVSLSLGTCAAILNLGQMGINRARSDARRSERRSRKGG